MNIIEFKDVVSPKMGKGEAFKEIESSYFDHLKFNINGVLSNKLGPKFFLTKGGLCQNHIINVVIDRFEDCTEHYVNALEDNWISKEFMSVVFTQKMTEMKPHEDAKTGGKGSVPHAVFTKSAKKSEVPDLELNDMFEEVSKLIETDAGQGDDGWDTMKGHIEHDQAERGDNLSNEKMY